MHVTPMGCWGKRSPSVQAELVSLRVAHDDVPRVEGQFGLMSVESSRAERHEAVALRLQCSHPLLPFEADGYPDVKVNSVLGRLSLGYLLEEQPRANLLGILDGGSGISLISRHSDSLEEGVPGCEYVRAVGHRDAGRAGNDVPQSVTPEGRERPGIVGVEGDLDASAHAIDDARFSLVPWE